MSNEPPPTLRQIAERAGVDRSTVSLALRNDPRLKATTRQKIQHLATQMGYRQNPTVAQLMSLLRAGQKHHFHSTIAVLCFGPVTVGTQMILTGAEKRARELGYGFEIFDSQELSPQRLEQVLVNRGIRGILASSQMGGNRLPDEFKFIWRKFSCCVVGIHPINPMLNFVTDDSYLTAMTAIQKLRDLGFRRIGFVMHRSINLQSEYRFVAAYLAAQMAYADLQSIPILLMEPDEGSRGAMLAWYKKAKPEVIICIQTEPLNWLKEAGYRVPEDISLVHLDVDAAGKQWAGMKTGRYSRGAVAIDVIVAQINCNETGVPASQRATLTEATWTLGSTLKLPTAKD